MDSTKQRKRIYPPSKRWGSQLLVLLLCLLPCAVIFVIQSIVAPGSFLHYQGRLFSLARVAVLLVVLVVCYVSLPYYLVRRLRPQIVAKVQALYGEDVAEAPMVGFSPGTEMKLHGGDSSSDFGLLLFDSERLIYRGDTLTFSLTRDQIESVSRVEQSCFGTRVPRILIGWRETPDAPLQGFAFESWDASTIWQCRKAADRLAQHMDEWRLI